MMNNSKVYENMPDLKLNSNTFLMDKMQQDSNNGHQSNNNSKLPPKDKNQSNRMNMKRRIVGNYMIGKCIGEGTFGQVKLGQHTLTGEKVSGTAVIVQMEALIVLF